MYQLSQNNYSEDLKSSESPESAVVILCACVFILNVNREYIWIFMLFKNVYFFLESWIVYIIIYKVILNRGDLNIP